MSLDFQADKGMLEDVVVWEAYSNDKDFRPKKFESSRLGISAKAKFSVRGISGKRFQSLYGYAEI